MYCTNCGAKLETGAQFCSSCGTATTAAAVAQSGPAAATPKRRMALWKKIAIGVAVFIVAVVGLALFLTSDLVEPIDRQIAALQAGDLDAAYAETSIGFRQATSRDQFADFVRANPALSQIADRSFSNRAWENNLGTVSGTLTTKDGGVIPITYRLVNENGAWRILNVELGARR